MVAYTTSTYNTGWMNGDIKGAFLSDTDDTDLVGTELVTNGTFDTDTSGWTPELSTLSVVGGALRVTQTASSGRVYQSFSTVIGKVYQFSTERLGGSPTRLGRILIGTAPANGSNYVGAYAASGVDTGYFVATGTTTFVTLQNNSPTIGEFFDFDNVSVKLADADRSVNANGLSVNGTVTRSPVATGADLVAYSGFSASNYLEQPYNSDLDFGTGDFCVMGWVKRTATSGNMLDRGNGSDSTDRIQVHVLSGAFRVVLNGTALATSAIPSGVWTHLTYVRRSGVGYLYLNSDLETSGAQAGDVSNTYATKVGIGQTLSDPCPGSLALLRISATAPTASQIAKIYEDEKVLFQENAQATLYGSSDAVTALAHDPDTGLLHVGTSAGRSVFQGLRRVDNTTTAVGTAISASNNLKTRSKSARRVGFPEKSGGLPRAAVLVLW
jgi:hypothetical protein